MEEIKNTVPSTGDGENKKLDSNNTVTAGNDINNVYFVKF